MVVSAFDIRMERAAKKEEADAALLEQAYGCVVTPFGQGQLPDDIRGYLHMHPDHLYIRWLPDRMVIRPALYLAKIKECAWLVDSKYSPLPNPFDDWLLEKDAHVAHRLQRTALGLPIVYIWPDGCSCSYVEDLSDEVLKPGNNRGNGSGTPYWKVPKKVTRPLDDVFGKGVA
jgi:hypothetical protein